MDAQYQYKPVKFFVAAFALTWIPWAVAAYLAAENPKTGFGHALNFLGLAAPMIVALCFIYGSGNVALRRDFHERMVNFRLLSWPHLLITIVLIPLLTFMAIWISLAIGESTEQFKVIDGALAWLPIILLAPTLEEIAWRGYGVDSIRARMGVLATSLVFGLLWAAWHTPLFFMKGTYHAGLADLGMLYVVNFYVSVVVLAVLSNWLYYRHGRFVIAAILLHFLVNTVAIIFGATEVTKVIVTGVYLVVVLAIVYYERELFSEGKRTFVEAR